VEEEDDSIKIAIVGKPNAGKSSLLNKLVGEDRVIVSPIAGSPAERAGLKANDLVLKVDGREDFCHGEAAGHAV